MATYGQELLSHKSGVPATAEFAGYGRLATSRVRRCAMKHRVEIRNRSRNQFASSRELRLCREARIFGPSAGQACLDFFTLQAFFWSFRVWTALYGLWEEVWQKRGAALPQGFRTSMKRASCQSLASSIYEKSRSTRNSSISASDDMVKDLNVSVGMRGNGSS